MPFSSLYLREVIAGGLLEDHRVILYACYTVCMAQCEDKQQ